MTGHPPASPAATAVIDALDEPACLALLARHRLCTLSVVDDAEPYAVPLYYGFDGTTVYLGLAEGRKTRILDANPRICLTVVDTGPGDAWACVQVTGSAEFLDDAHREEGVRVLLEHNRRIRETGRTESAGAIAGDETATGAAPPPRRHAGGRILRVRNPRFSGRTRP